MSPSVFPKVHNALWPGVVGKGGKGPDDEPCIGLETMLNLTAAAEVNGQKFDGVDLFLHDPHVPITANDDFLKFLAESVQSRKLVIGSMVAPVWSPTGGGSAMGSFSDRARFLIQVDRACRIALRLRELGVRPYGIVRIDTATGPGALLEDPEGRAKCIETLRLACNIAETYGERLAVEGEVCWAELHSWRKARRLLYEIDRPSTIGFQADMAHTLLYLLGVNAPEDRILPEEWNWDRPATLDHAFEEMTFSLRPLTIDFHVAQNDATVKGSSTHDKTGRHCLPNDPNGKLDIPHHAGFWLRNPGGKLTKACRHICWDGCMFSNETMLNPQTWNDILAAMIAVRDAHSWTE